MAANTLYVHFNHVPSVDSLRQDAISSFYITLIGTSDCIASRKGHLHVSLFVGTCVCFTMDQGILQI